MLILNFSGSKIVFNFKNLINLLIILILFFSFKIILISKDLDLIVSNIGLDLLLIKIK